MQHLKQRGVFGNKVMRIMGNHQENLCFLRKFDSPLHDHTLISQTVILRLKIEVSLPETLCIFTSLLFRQIHLSLGQ